MQPQRRQPGAPHRSRSLHRGTVVDPRLPAHPGATHGTTAPTGWAHAMQWLTSRVGAALLMATVVVALQWQPARAADEPTCPVFPNPQDRFGFNVARENGKRIDDYDVTPLHGRWYLDYATQEVASQPAEMVYAQMIRANRWTTQTMSNTLRTIDAVTANHPGTLWILGNEPDRDKQDGQTPAEYAVFYHDVYEQIKARDPSSRVAIGGVVQSTPLRRHYLDLVLSEYQRRYGRALPVDVWTIHAFILPENYEWGASIPPGMAEFADEGMQYTVDDHDSQPIFQANIRAFRQWMAENGYRDKPLLITEYGILLSVLHGFPHERVRNFMIGSFDYFLTATDAAIGYPADGNRLVQAWSWFSLNYPPYDLETGIGHNGNLLTPEGALLPLGQEYGAYVSALESSADLTLELTRFALAPSVVVTPTAAITTPITATPPAMAAWPPTLTLTTQVQNVGNVAGCHLQLELWHQPPGGSSVLVGRQPLQQLAAEASHTATFAWQPTQLDMGAHQVQLRVTVDNGQLGLPILWQAATQTLLVLDEPLTQRLYLPIVQ